jgi:L-alanine-DL-glutamate epimerase-like enolase superfamily enzyme
MSLTIIDLEFYLVEIGCFGREPPVRSLVVRLGTGSGLEGWGEAQVEWKAEELPARRDALFPVLAERSAFEIEELLALAALRSAPLRCAVEMASWDLIGRAAGEPLCHLFGGGYRPRVPVAVHLQGGRPDATARMARELAELGFHWQTVCSCGDVSRDVEMVAAVLQSTPDRTELQFDAATSYDMDAARDLCTELEGFGLSVVLDPLASRDLDQVASLRRQTSVPLGVWRAIRSPSDVLALVRCGAAPFAVVDLQRVGGLTTARKCAAILQAAGLGAALSTGPSLGIGSAAVLQLVSATPAFAGCNPCAPLRLRDDVIAEPLAIAEGMIAVPKGPGLGVEVDRGKVERYQVT